MRNMAKKSSLLSGPAINQGLRRLRNGPHTRVGLLLQYSRGERRRCWMITHLPHVAGAGGVAVPAVLKQGVRAPALVRGTQEEAGVLRLEVQLQQPRSLRPAERRERGGA